MNISAQFSVVAWKYRRMNIKWLLPALTHVPGGLQGIVRSSHWRHPEQTVPWRPAEDCVTLWVCVERPVALWQGGQATGWCGDSVKPWGKLLTNLLKIRAKWAALISRTIIRNIFRCCRCWTVWLLFRGSGQNSLCCALCTCWSNVCH